ncbi:unnamed protein product [Cuscuta campestris]|uniref:MATH domain-containing protein n=1 Tax=Cuscuta campestris TaxID=132261 RepID=A0A484N2I0_9ASTE|nr:unnamed protein product [Cuscuta campestris]
MSKFTWRIENFSQLDAKKLYSLTFLVNQNKWRVLLCPKGNNTDHLSLYLDVPDSYSLPADWSVPTKFSISLINQIDCNGTITKETDHTFNSKESDWGFTSFVPLSEFHDKSGGFLVEDICLIEAEVYVSQASSDKDLSASLAINTVDSVYIEAQSFLESLHKAPITGVSNATCEMPMFEGHSTFAKEIFDKLISYRLEDLAEPKHETAMMDSLCKLTNHLHLFSDVQAKQIVNLKATFPQIMQEWRDSVQVKSPGGHPWSTLEKTKSLLQDLVKTEEGIQTKLKDLNNTEKELEAQLEAIKSNSRQLQEEREDVSKQTKIVCSLAKDQASRVQAKEAEIDRANKTLEQRLKSEWAATRHLFA